MSGVQHRETLGTNRNPAPERVQRPRTEMEKGEENTRGFGQSHIKQIFTLACLFCCPTAIKSHGCVLKSRPPGVL